MTSTGNPSRTFARTLLSVIAIAVFTIALRAPLLDIPFERDEGEYAYIAWRLEHNELPYRDWFDQKPPAIFWVYRLALSLPMDAIRSVHAVGMLFALATALGLFFIARRMVGEAWAAAAALLFALLAADPALQGTAANTELFMSLPIVVAAFLYLASMQDGRGGAKSLVAVGVASGVAMAFKQVAAANWLFLVLASPFLLPAGSRLRGTARFALWSGIGIAAFWGAVAAYFLAHGALGEFVYNVFTHNFEYVRSLPFSERIGNLKETLTSLAGTEAIVWAFAACGLIACYRSLGGAYPFLAGWLAAGIAGASASGYYFPHYFQQLLPPLALFALLGAKRLHDAELLHKVPRHAREAVCLGALAVLPCYGLSPFIFSYTPEEAVRRIYPGNSFAKMPEYGKLIGSLTRPDDRVFIFGAEPELLFYARRVSATKYIFLFPLYGPYSDSLGKQTQTAREVAAARPSVVVYRPNGLFFAPGTEQYFTRWTESFLDANYRPQTFLTPSNYDIELFLPRR